MLFEWFFFHKPFFGIRSYYRHRKMLLFVGELKNEERLRTLYVYIFSRSTIDSNRSEEDLENQRRGAIHAIESALEKYMKPIETEQKETNKQVTAMRYEFRKCVDQLDDSWFKPRDVILVVMVILLNSFLQMFWSRK